MKAFFALSTILVVALMVEAVISESKLSKEQIDECLKEASVKIDNQWLPNGYKEVLDGSYESYKATNEVKNDMQTLRICPYWYERMHFNQVETSCGSDLANVTNEDIIKQYKSYERMLDMMKFCDKALRKNFYKTDIALAGTPWAFISYGLKQGLPVY